MGDPTLVLCKGALPLGVGVFPLGTLQASLTIVCCLGVVSWPIKPFPDPSECLFFPQVSSKGAFVHLLKHVILLASGNHKLQVDLVALGVKELSV